MQSCNWQQRECNSSSCWASTLLFFFKLFAIDSIIYTYIDFIFPCSDTDPNWFLIASFACRVKARQPKFCARMILILVFTGSRCSSTGGSSPAQNFAWRLRWTNWAAEVLFHQCQRSYRPEVVHSCLSLALLILEENHWSHMCLSSILTGYYEIAKIQSTLPMSF